MRTAPSGIAARLRRRVLSRTASWNISASALAAHDTQYAQERAERSTGRKTALDLWTVPHFAIARIIINRAVPPPRANCSVDLFDWIGSNYLSHLVYSSNSRVYRWTIDEERAIPLEIIWPNNMNLCSTLRNLLDNYCSSLSWWFFNLISQVWCTILSHNFCRQISPGDRTRY